MVNQVEADHTAKGNTMPTIDIDERAWNLYRQIQDQRAVLRSYEAALQFVRVRQVDAPAEFNEPIARKLWEIAERMRGDSDPDWVRR